ncbi:hypothetical protein EPO33_00625 [Patescibacteria group bacterium]|nr:MAG: hypothetical protein EPO33_00625 [Patescibacteria group bacterium]
MFQFTWRDALSLVWDRLVPRLDAEGRNEMILRAACVAVLATVVAGLEIQIEGAHGWAGELPCWRPEGHEWYARLWDAAMGGKPMTGYHVFAFALWNLLFFIPFCFGVKITWSRAAEALMWSHLLAVLEDFLWFVWNPHYGLGRFAPEHIWWHADWWGPVPSDYPLMLLRVLVLAAFAPRGLRGAGLAIGLLGIIAAVEVVAAALL